MPPRGYLTFLAACLLHIVLGHGCDYQCYKPKIEAGNAKAASEVTQNYERDAVVEGVCYSTYVLNIMNVELSDLSSLSCTDRQKLKGCIAGCSSHRNSGSLRECQLKCSSCVNESKSASTKCDSNCDFTACILGCNSTASYSRSAISLGNTNVMLAPVPGKLYFYKAKVEVAENTMQSTTSMTGPIVIKMLTLDVNITSYRLLHDPNTDMLDLSALYSSHCKLANISAALVNSDGISEYSKSREMCISAHFPQAADNLQSCFGEEIGFDISKKYIIDLKWELPADVTYLEGFLLSVTSKKECKRDKVKITLSKDQTRYTVGKRETIKRGCQYQISLISIPRFKTNNTAVITQSAMMPQCQDIRPDYEIDLYQQYNYNGNSTYTLNVTLESDPAALQALDFFIIRIDKHSTLYPSANEFPSYLFSVDNNHTKTYGSECFKKDKHYTCLDNCDSLHYNGANHEKCIQQCENASKYHIELGESFPSDEILIIGFVFYYKRKYSYRCEPLEIKITSSSAQCYSPTPPKNFTLQSSSIQQGILAVNLTWTPPIQSHGYIKCYYVEFFFNDTTKVRADNGCKNRSWSNNLTINPNDYQSPKQISSDDLPYHKYYIASGVIVGFMVFVIVVLTTIIICCFYMCKENEGNNIKIDESIIGPGSSIRNPANRRPENIESVELPIDDWEMSPDNVEMDQSTFLACGNFGEVYKGKLRTVTVSQNKSYLAGKLVAVKILKEDAGYDLKHDFLQEINLMKKIAEGGNPFIVNMVGCCTVEEPLALIMEFVSGGNLLEFLRAHRQKPSQEMDTVVGRFLEYLVGKGIIHRDLACRNILVGDNNNMKIADFGLSKHLYDDPVYVKNQDGKLPIRWMANEAILERRYSVQSDVWSFGIVVWEIFTFVVDAILKGYRMECPSNLCPPELYALAKQCWNADPDQRPSFDTLTSDISDMIQDYDPSQYIDVSQYDPYCEMHSANIEKKFCSSDDLNVEDKDEL